MSTATKGTIAACPEDPPPGFGLSAPELRDLANEFWRLFSLDDDDELGEPRQERAEDWFWRAFEVLSEEESHACDAGAQIQKIAESMLCSEAVALELMEEESRAR
jgi:hypothetical protein